jgi:hypothetical protein
MKLPSFMSAAWRRLFPRAVASRVWVFNNIPAGARVDTRVSCPLPRRRRSRA